MTSLSFPRFTAWKTGPELNNKEILLKESEHSQIALIGEAKRWLPHSLSSPSDDRNPVIAERRERHHGDSGDEAVFQLSAVQTRCVSHWYTGYSIDKNWESPGETYAARRARAAGAGAMNQKSVKQLIEAHQ